MKTKKIIAVILSVAVIMSGLAFWLVNAYAETVRLDDTKLGLELYSNPSGYDDKLWYVYTPTQSGIYTFYGIKNSETGGTNLYNTEAYLFEKTEDENGKKFYTQLAYSNGNPDYANYPGASSKQFCIKYHLEAGKNYYYAVGFLLEERSVTIYSKLIAESYDTANLISITPHCDAELTWYTDGSWENDSDGNPYYLYNIS